MTRRHWTPNPEGRPLAVWSFAEIARETGTPAWRVRRLAVKMGLAMGHKPTRAHFEAIRLAMLPVVVEMADELGQKDRRRKMRAKERRNRMAADGRHMRRLRSRYVSRIRRWLEADRERVYVLAEHMRKLGLYAAGTSANDARTSIIIVMAKLDGHDTYELRRRWLLKTGWAAFHGWAGSRRLRAKGKVA